MADQSFPVESGFYDAINQDRVYTADDMNRPYKRVVSDGVFATKVGTPSTDLQVFPGEGERQVLVSAGQAIILHKWFELPSPVTVTVPENNTLFTRIDSVIARVDVTDQVRAGSIVYRTGTAEASPTPPAINQDGTNVLEYRVANVHVAAGATTITASAIEDLRGSAECPWITGLITQVDTSTLFEQYQAAYKEQYDKYDEDYAEYTAEQRERWDAFIETLTEELEVVTSTEIEYGSATAAEGQTEFSIPFLSYNHDTDSLEVFINGLFGVVGTDFTFNNDFSAIVLTTAADAGARIDFRCIKSVISANIDNAMAIVERIDSIVSAFIADTGEIPLTLSPGVAAVSGKTPTVRCIGGRVYMHGAVTGITGTGQIGTIPGDLVPSSQYNFVSAAWNGSTASSTLVLTVSSTGIVSISARSASIAASAQIPISATFLASAQPTVSLAYNYLGSVETYAQLPGVGQKSGDVWQVLTSDGTHGIDAGDWVMWNGTAWEKMNGSITESQIASAVNAALA